MANCVHFPVLTTLLIDNPPTDPFTDVLKKMMSLNMCAMYLQTSGRTVVYNNNNNNCYCCCHVKLLIFGKRRRRTAP